MPRLSPKVDDRVVFIEKVEQGARVMGIGKIGFHLMLDDGRDIWTSRKDFIFSRKKK